MNFFLCFSVMCVVFLSGVVIFKSIKNDIGGPVGNPSNPVQWWPQDFGGLLTAIAISGLTFSCHFNILPMHGELQHQTRANKRIILYTAMALTYVLNLLVSFFGFFQVRQVSSRIKTAKYTGDSSVIYCASLLRTLSACTYTT